MTQQLRNEAEQFKEKVYYDYKADSLKAVLSLAGNIEKPFSMMKVEVSDPDTH